MMIKWQRTETTVKAFGQALLVQETDERGHTATRPAELADLRQAALATGYLLVSKGATLCDNCRRFTETAKTNHDD